MSPLNKENGEISLPTSVSVPGKIILSGEHAVVYGYPAILAALDRRLSVQISSGEHFQIFSQHKSQEYAEFGARKASELMGVNLGSVNIRIDSNIPVGAGMGSSAALAVALTAAMARYKGKERNLEEINKIAYEIEKKQHGRPSGGDNTIVTYGGFLKFKRNGEGSFDFESFLPQSNMPSIFIINTGTSNETTGEMVIIVRDLYQSDKHKIEAIFKKIGEITDSFLRYLKGEGEVDVSILIRENQKLLEHLGVVSPFTKEIVRKIEAMGGAAKISGAGGIKGNSGILLCLHEDPEKLINFCRKNDLNYLFPVSLGEEGVRWEEV